MTWDRGRADIERLLATGELEQVEPSEAVAERLLHDAAAHARTAAGAVEEDAAGALQLAYDACRKASAALLAAQGLRATSRGGHIAVVQAVRAQFNASGGVPVFGQIDALRRRRNASEYPSEDSPGTTSADAAHALDVAEKTLDAAQRLLGTGKLGRFSA